MSTRYTEDNFPCYCNWEISCSPSMTNCISEIQGFSFGSSCSWSSLGIFVSLCWLLSVFFGFDLNTLGSLLVTLEVHISNSYTLKFGSSL